MLVITRKPGEKIVIGEDIVITVMEVAGQSARLAIEAPRAVPIYREEIWAAVKQENEASATAKVGSMPQVERASA